MTAQSLEAMHSSVLNKVNLIRKLPCSPLLRPELCTHLWLQVHPWINQTLTTCQIVLLFPCSPDKLQYSAMHYHASHLFFFMRNVMFFLWFISGTRAYDKLEVIIMKKSILNDVKKLSPDAQTSSLEGFHSTLNQWHPKMLCFSWLGTYCR